MKKTISLILSMFLLLSSCGKIKELMNPTSDTSAQAKAAAQVAAAAAAQAKVAIEQKITAQTVEPAGTQAPKEPEIKTPSESEMKSDETKEKQEAENKEETPEQKPATNSWFTKEKIAIATGTAVGAYAVYKFMDWVINADYEIPHREVVDDEYSEGTFGHFLLRGEGIDNTIRNERIALDAEVYNFRTPVVHVNVKADPGKPTRLVGKNGDIVKREHEAQYKANWEKYKRIHYPNHKFD